MHEACDNQKRFRIQPTVQARIVRTYSLLR
jgi:hypothetical protein